MDMATISIMTNYSCLNHGIFATKCAEITGLPCGSSVRLLKALREDFKTLVPRVAIGAGLFRLQQKGFYSAGGC